MTNEAHVNRTVGRPVRSHQRHRSGLVERCMTSGQVGRIYGARNGIKGVIDGNYIDLTEELASPERLELLCHTPAAALGSCG